MSYVQLLNTVSPTRFSFYYKEFSLFLNRSTPYRICPLGSSYAIFFIPPFPLTSRSCLSDQLPSSFCFSNTVVLKSVQASPRGIWEEFSEYAIRFLSQSAICPISQREKALHYCRKRASVKCRRWLRSVWFRYMIS